MSARGNERGQALVWVAIVFVLLLATLALAVDFGNIWTQRRHMQNAADAAALEAARARCFANASAAAAKASGEAYAKPPHNTATGATVSPSADGWTFNAKVWTDAPTYFAGVFGVSKVHVEAGARATCGEANGACNLFPTAFSKVIWGEQLAGKCGAPFFVWSSSKDGGEDLDCNVYDCTHVDGQPVMIINDLGRDWVDFSGATDPNYPPGCSASNGQGAAELKCWVSGSGYQAAVPLPNYICKDHGIKWGVKNEVDARVQQPYPLNVVRIPLASNPPAGAVLPARKCSGSDLLYIDSYGCGTLLGAEKQVELCEKGDEKKTKCAKFKAIEMAVSCDKACNTGCGKSSGGGGDVRGVGLVP